MLDVISVKFFGKSRIGRLRWSPVRECTCNIWRRQSGPPPPAATWTRLIVENCPAPARVGGSAGRRRRPPRRVHPTSDLGPAPLPARPVRLRPPVPAAPSVRLIRTALTPSRPVFLLMSNVGTSRLSRTEHLSTRRDARRRDETTRRDDERGRAPASGVESRTGS